jgi:lambda family phage portal protein
MKPNLIQRAANWLTRKAPAQQLRRFEAARLDRLAGDWFATANSINQELQNDLDLIRRRGRQLAHNNDYAAKFVKMVQNNIIGPTGVRLQSKVEDSPGKPDRMASAAIELAWKEWGQAADVTGQMSFVDLLNSIVGSLPADGEFLVRMVKGADAGNRFNFALQVIDVDRIDTTFNGQHEGNTVIMGVEVNAYRRPVALHLFEAHPSDGARSSRRRVRVSTDEMLHRFKVTRAEQVRGIPWMAPGMLSLHHLGGFMLSALLAAEHGANHYGFFTTPDGMAPIGQAEQGQQVTTSQPGMYDTLPTGVQFTPHDSKYPNEVFGPFAKTTLQRIATGWGVAYHSLANDLEGVSFSSIRSGTLEERDRWVEDQEWLIGCFIEPVFKAWLQMALLSGAITMPNGSALPASKAAKFARHEWQARRWEWVDPQADMNAKVLAVKAGLMAPQDLCASMGYDYEDTIKAIGQAQELAKEFGVSLTAYEGAPGAQTAANAGAQPTQPNGGRSQHTETLATSTGVNR